MTQKKSPRLVCTKLAGFIVAASFLMELGVSRIDAQEQTPAPKPPAVNIFSPEDGVSFAAPVNIRIWVEATDTDGMVKSVEFFAGTNSLGVVTNDLTQLAEMSIPDLIAAAANLPPLPQPFVPFRLTWTNAPPGAHVLTAVATDDQGLSAVSAPIHIKVLAPDSQTVVSIVATDPVATEPDAGGGEVDTALFTISRTGQTDAPLEVHYRTGGTASNGADYRELVGTVTVPAGARSAELVLTPIDDALLEGTESVVVSLETPACAEIFPRPPGCYLVGRQSEAKAQIRDNDKSPANRPPVVTLVRPFDDQVFAAPANLTLVAVARDTDGEISSVEFFEGEHSLGVVTNRSQAKPVASPKERDHRDGDDDDRDDDRDSVREIDKWAFFQLAWTNIPPGSYALTALAKDNLGATTRSRPAEIKVVEKKEPPVVTVVATDAEASEGASTTNAPNNATFTVKRTGETNSALTVHYRLSGTARNGADYRELSGKVNIPAGAATADVVVAPIDDKSVEGTQSVILTLLPTVCVPSFPPPKDCYRVGEPNQARAAILDNDVNPANLPPKIALFRPVSGARFVAGTTIEIRAEAADADGWISLVEFFESTNKIGAVKLDAAERSSTHTFSVKWTNAPLGKFTLTAQATDNQGASSVSSAVEISVVAIQVGEETNTPPLITISARDAYASEGNREEKPNTATFMVKRSGDKAAELKVYYSISGTASNGVDYVTLSGVITIPAGEKSANVVLTPIDDQEAEKIETVILKLELPPSDPATTNKAAAYRLGEHAKAAAIIKDNDSPKPQCVRLPDGLFHVCMPGLKGLKFRIEASADLQTWVTVDHDTEADGKIHFVDPDAHKHGQRYYRVVPTPDAAEDE